MGVRAKTPEEIFCPTNTPGLVLKEGKKARGVNGGKSKDTRGDILPNKHTRPCVVGRKEGTGSQWG